MNFKNAKLHLLLIVHLICGPLLSLRSSARFDVFDPSSDLLSAAAAFGVSHTQGCLLGLWFAFANTSWWKRSVLLLLGLLYVRMLQVVALSLYDDIGAYTCSLELGVSIVFAILLLIARMWGIRLYRGAPNDCRIGESSKRFSIQQLMLLVVLLAIWLKIAVVLRKGEKSTVLLRDISMIDGSFVLIAIVSVWTMLGPARVILRLHWIAILTFLVVRFNIYVLGDLGNAMFWPLAAPILFHAVVISASLFLLRLSGYRLVQTDGSGKR